ncbi:hypothetical protein K437DRAFT_254363 [Tilletiaria anomala UBC 951]|uniref:Restriction of telomere capping protein 4 n=1 Tax=Tilletiaria anomala (strain ATCC 24038 / CBS 436.72 / UBC 951) TaxID=1037660 RepID=A0A066WF50_TILAU|nr:uncharacterized protein K437DRAFT_254363 [Tilletiaria anomala UBC 951]KDN52376.1 hypothetical protein K437DRAFT_254363 [Tilletiaria anomala UBC 951]
MEFLRNQGKLPSGQRAEAPQNRMEANFKRPHPSSTNGCSALNSPNWRRPGENDDLLAMSHFQNHRLGTSSPVIPSTRPAYSSSSTVAAAESEGKAFAAWDLKGPDAGNHGKSDRSDSDIEIDFEEPETEGDDRCVLQNGQPNFSATSQPNPPQSTQPAGSAISEPGRSSILIRKATKLKLPSFKRKMDWSQRSSSLSPMTDAHDADTGFAVDESIAIDVNSGGELEAQVDMKTVLSSEAVVHRKEKTLKIIRIGSQTRETYKHAERVEIAFKALEKKQKVQKNVEPATIAASGAARISGHAQKGVALKLAPGWESTAVSRNHIVVSEVPQASQGGKDAVEARDGKAAKVRDVEAAKPSDMVTRKAKDLQICPFCDGRMPDKMTQKLESMMQGLLDRYHEDGPLSISAMHTIGTCVRHEDERVHVPEGVKAGWPQILNKRELEQRVRDPIYWSVLQQRIKDPTTSEWYLAISERVAKVGKKAFSTTQQMQNIEDQRAGYYGQQGWEHLLTLLLTAFTKGTDVDPRYHLTSKDALARIEPLNPTSFVHSILMPELIFMLLRDDMERYAQPNGSADVKRLRDASTRYGSALFPSDGEGIDPRELVADDQVERSDERGQHQGSQQARNGSSRSSSSGVRSSQKSSSQPFDIAKIAIQKRSPRR